MQNFGSRLIIGKYFFLDFLDYNFQEKSISASKLSVLSFKVHCRSTEASLEKKKAMKIIFPKTFEMKCHVHRFYDRSDSRCSHGGIG